MNAEETDPDMKHCIAEATMGGVYDIFSNVAPAHLDGEVGQADAGKAALLELCRGQPNISLAWIAEQIPTKQDAERGHYLEALSRAGLD